MATTARGVNLIPSRIPQKTTSLSVSKLTDKISKLNTNPLNTTQIARQPPPSPQKPAKANPTSPTGKKNSAAATIRTTITQTRTTNGPLKTDILKTAAVPLKPSNVLKKKPEPVRKTETPPGMSSCKACGRHFATDRVQKHEEICKKTSKKKRKVFDPVKHRLKGTDAEGMLTQIKKTTKTLEQPKKNNWRKVHEEFIKNIRAARQVKEHLAKGGKLSDLPPPPPLDTSSYIQCPHCGRKFNEAAAERHIAVCVNMRHNKPKPVPTKTNTNKSMPNKMVTRKR